MRRCCSSRRTSSRRLKTHSRCSSLCARRRSTHRHRSSNFQASVWACLWSRPHPSSKRSPAGVARPQRQTLLLTATHRPSLLSRRATCTCLKRRWRRRCPRVPRCQRVHYRIPPLYDQMHTMSDEPNRSEYASYASGRRPNSMRGGAESPRPTPRWRGAAGARRRVRRRQELRQPVAAARGRGRGRGRGRPSLASRGAESGLGGEVVAVGGAWGYGDRRGRRRGAGQRRLGRGRRSDGRSPRR